MGARLHPRCTRSAYQAHHFPSQFKGIENGLSGKQAECASATLVGQKRRTYTFTNSAEDEVLGMSFIHSEGSIDDWLNNSERQQVVDSLAQMLLIPPTRKRYRLDRVLNSN